MTDRARQDATRPGGAWYRRMAARVELASANIAGRSAARFAVGRRLPAGWYAAWAAGLIAVFIVLAATVDGAAEQGARRLPQSVVQLFAFLTQFGTAGWFLWPLGLFLIAIAAIRVDLATMSQRVTVAIAVRAGFLFAAIAAPGLFVTIAKRLIGRARPFVGGSLDPFLFKPFAWLVEYSSLPSGHATNAAAVAVAFGSIWPRARTAVWIYAAVIMASRVIITAHYPSDVLIGALAGGGGAIVVRRWFAAKRLGFSITSGGAVTPFPVPSLRRTKAVARDLLAD